MALATIKPDIRSQNAEVLQAFLAEGGHPAFRAKQVQEWLWAKHATEFGQMTNLPISLREQLAEAFALQPAVIETRQKSSDGTIKVSFRLPEGYLVEGVLIPTEDRVTACISSQVGCSLTCSFCATGFMDRKRNLEAGEIVDQVVLLQQEAEQAYGRGITNIVYMGMGEPLLNYKNVVRSAEILHDPKGMNLAAKRLTVSTAGIAKQIIALAEEPVKVKLALSLHAADDEKRSRVMPINDKNNLEVLWEALDIYTAQTRQRVTFEYIVFPGFNDGEKDAKNLIRLCRRVNSKVNLIEYNPIPEAEFGRPTAQQMDRFAARLIEGGIMASIRRSRGEDIDAACGQLANRGQEPKKTSVS